jgi:hypothetical protein
LILPKKTERALVFNEGPSSRRRDNGSKPARHSANGNNTIGAPSFSPYRSRSHRSLFAVGYLHEARYFSAPLPRVRKMNGISKITRNSHLFE